MKYTVSLTLTVELDIPEGSTISPSDNDIREAAWGKFEERYKNGDFDADSIEVELV